MARGSPDIRRGYARGPLANPDPDEAAIQASHAAHMVCPTAGPVRPGRLHYFFAFWECLGTDAVELKMRTNSAIMNTFRRVCAKIVAGLVPVLPGGLMQAAQPGQTQALVDGNTAFACDLYSQLRNSPGNLFFSPYSVSTALAMTYAGARGDTETQMAQVLHLGKNQPGLHSAFGALQRQLNQAQQQKGIELSVANALWAQQDHPFLPAFLDIGKSEYEASLSQTDFKTSAEAARLEINGWVARKTKDRIKDILPPGSLDLYTRLVLANAIYFKGAWAEPFPKAETSPQPFHLTASRQTDVPLMHHFDTVKYLGNDSFQAVELPYAGGELSQVVLLPRKIDGCGALEGQLSAGFLSRCLGQMKRQPVELFLPRFKMESNFKLGDTLGKMGMSDAFGPKANFSGMDGTQNLFISDVFHKAWVEVNEEGTEAAAATVVAVPGSVGMTKPPPPPPVFRADHPFIFCIRDTRSGSLLFLGRLADPAH
jgi:serpin B